ncbi:MAG: DUF1475 family protein [Acidimicrobiia bacterium]
MVGVRVFTLALTVVMVVSIGFTMVTGDFGEEGRWILDNPWGRLSLIDLYVGVALIAGWAVLRERSLLTVVLWLPVFIILGNGGTALYATVAAFRSTDVRQFLLGARS